MSCVHTHVPGIWPIDEIDPKAGTLAVICRSEIVNMNFWKCANSDKLTHN